MRKKKSFFNIIGSLFSYFTAMIFNFITQACIVRIMGIEYSGVNGLFTNILTMLSIAELGIGTTIIFKLYKPIADNNIESIKSWLNFYKICYRFVALIVAVVGIVIIPFVPIIIGYTSIKENLIILYVIALLDTIFSYVMTYKRSILYADQKNYIINFVHTLYLITMNITQIFILYITKNFIYFLIVKFIFRIIENIILNLYVNNHYSYVNDKYEVISDSEKIDVFDRIKAMLLQKISFVINKGIDNIVISTFLGIAFVGYYTSYNLVVSGIVGIIYQIVSSMTASVGNLLTENDAKKHYQIFKKINFFNSFLTCVAVVGFFNVIQDFITLWLGKKYLLSIWIVVSFSIYIYSDSIRRAITIFKEAAGICKEDRFVYIAMALINLFTSVILCKFIGISGVVIGTSISYLYLLLYSYPKYIFIPLFRKRFIDYYREYFKYFLYIIISCILSYLICIFFDFNILLLQLVVKSIVSIFVSSILFVLFFHKTDEFDYYFKILKKIIARKVN